MIRFQYKKQTYLPSGILLPICIFSIILFVFLRGLSSLTESTVRRQKEALENAIMRDITCCYAVEGTYPESLQYLKEHYGLTYDETLFYVDYHTTGSNILPDVTIIERED